MADRTARSVFRTKNGAKYIAQLGKHWAHKPGTTVDETLGTINFQNGNKVAFDLASDQLTVIASTPADGDIDRWKDVVENHLMRFAFREKSDLSWDTGSD